MICAIRILHCTTVAHSTAQRNILRCAAIAAQVWVKLHQKGTFPPQIKYKHSFKAPLWVYIGMWNNVCVQPVCKHPIVFVSCCPEHSIRAIIKAQKFRMPFPTTKPVDCAPISGRSWMTNYDSGSWYLSVTRWKHVKPIAYKGFRD